MLRECRGTNMDILDCYKKCKQTYLCDPRTCSHSIFKNTDGDYDIYLCELDKKPFCKKLSKMGYKKIPMGNGRFLCPYYISKKKK